MRSFLAIIAVIALLACPMDCAAKYAIARTAGEDTIAACCDHCRENHTSDTSENPAAPEQKPEQDGRCCVCKGAIFVATDLTQINGQFESDTCTWIDAPVDSVGKNHVQILEARVGVPPPWQGIEWRIAIHSLII